MLPSVTRKPRGFSSSRPPKNTSSPPPQRRGLVSGFMVVAILLAGIGLGSRNLLNYDPALLTYTGGARKDVIRKRKLDTVFFLSDGKPSHGKLVDTNEILKEVVEINKMYRIVFHTIAIGQFQKEFLRELARKNGGVFVDLGS